MSKYQIGATVSRRPCDGMTAEALAIKMRVTGISPDGYAECVSLEKLKQIEDGAVDCWGKPMTINGEAYEYRDSEIMEARLA